ncbi:MAG: hypothetical protein NC079_00215 [Clostridium sp.]|nr:hypothetical protein [Clostridium sp.]
MALSPDLTQKLSVMLYGEEGPEAYRRNKESSGESGEETAEDVSDLYGDISGIANGVLKSESGAGYVAPLRGAINLPEQVSGRNGYEPVNAQNEELTEEQAEEPGTDLSTGPVGDGLTFDAAFYPYYHMLNDKMQHLYRQIYANALELRNSFAPVEQVNTAQLKNVFEAVYNDHPELFWLDTGYSCKYRPDGICVQVSLLYNRTAQNLDQSKAEFETAAKKILDGAAAQSDDYAKEQYVHDELVKKADYMLSASMNQSAYSALVNGNTVCAGYARAFQYLMQQLGIPCYYCVGYSGEDHAWNIVAIDGGYRNVDVTWDDTNPSTYDYFNKTDADFVGTHVRTGLSVYLPPCGNGYTGVSGNFLPEDNLVGGITLNPNPQQPLTWVPKEKDDKDRDGVSVVGGITYDLDAAGLSADSVQDTLEKYYENCLKQMVDRGSGQQSFSNAVPKNVLDEIERAYGTGAYEKGYVDEGLEKLKMEYFAIQIQVEELGGNYYRLYHNIYTW